MARRIPVLKCFICAAVVYSLTLTLLFMWWNPATSINFNADDKYGTQSITKIHDLPRVVELMDQIISNNFSSFLLQHLSHFKGHNVTLQDDHQEWGKHMLAVVVPFRDRFEELMEFAPHLYLYLLKKKIRHKIYVINQIDSLRFNRGSLINIGALESDPDCDYIAMHDVDLLPLSDQLDYSYPQSGPFHIAAPSLHPLYHYPTFIGGILLITKEHFSLVNGLSNRYYGWGREDDEFYVRLKKAGLLKTGYITMNGSQTVAYEIRRPQNVSTGLNTFKHIHEKQRRPRDSSNFFDQKAKTNKLDRETGVSTVKYDVKATHHVMLDGAPVTVLDVKLSCDYMKTPWCLKKEDHYLLDSVITQHPPGHR